MGEGSFSPLPSGERGWGERRRPLNPNPPPPGGEGRQEILLAGEIAMDRLSNKRCLIVGGTGGIGQAAARRFVEEGARVVVAGLDVPETASAAAFVPCDATD